MPEMDSFEVLERLRAMGRAASSSAPVMFVTSLDTGEDEERCLERGAVDYVSKPIKPSVVVARVKTQLELRRVRAAMQQNNQVLDVEIAARMRQSNLVRSATIRAFAQLAETRDNDTGNHLRRTQEYVRILTEQLSADPKLSNKLTSDQRALIVESAPLHDIGKVGVPDHVLRKPEKLTREEFEVMKTHAAIGANALEHAAKQCDPPVDFFTSPRRSRALTTSGGTGPATPSSSPTRASRSRRGSWPSPTCSTRSRPRACTSRR